MWEAAVQFSWYGWLAAVAVYSDRENGEQQ